MRVLGYLAMGVFCLAVLGQCDSCYKSGGTPVRGVIGYECMKK